MSDGVVVYLEHSANDFSHGSADALATSSFYT